MSDIFELVEGRNDGAVIKVVGVGGGGSNTVNQMVEGGILGVEFICANTDAQHLNMCKSESLLQLGAEITRGLGAGSDPEVGRQAAEEDRDRIREVVQGTDMLFITAGMGGGTGTGAAPVVAEIAKEAGVLTVAVVTKPFPFEGKKRMQVALEGIAQMQQFVDSIIVIPNERLLTVLGRNISLKAAFKASNDVLHNAVQGIADLITQPGLMNVDFADVRKIMSARGMAMMGSGSGKGENRAADAAKAALSCPLLEDINLTGARGLLINVTANDTLSMEEFDLINRMITEIAADDAEVKPGHVLNHDVGDEVRVTVVATGLGRALQQKVPKLPRTRDGAIDLAALNTPAINRVPREKHAMEGNAALDLEYLDIPAFLRHQAD